MKVVDISRSYVLDALRERCRVQTFRATAARDAPLGASIQLDGQRPIGSWRCLLSLDDPTAAR